MTATLPVTTIALLMLLKYPAASMAILTMMATTLRRPKISTHNKVNKADQENHLSQHASFNLSDGTLTRFLSRARGFTTLSGRLQRGQDNRCHQLYTTPSQRFALIRKVHSSLGQQGFYSTCCIIFNRFWWPPLECDIGLTTSTYLAL